MLDDFGRFVWESTFVFSKQTSTRVTGQLRAGIHGAETHDFGTRIENDR